jgi:hypothetical protein
MWSLSLKNGVHREGFSSFIGAGRWRLGFKPRRDYANEHYEIARYGTLIAWAEILGHDDIIRLLNTNLKEEKAADKKLSTVALRKGVNRKAAS